MSVRGAEDSVDQASGSAGFGLAAAWHVVSTAAVSLLFLAFVVAHVTNWLATGRPTGIVLAVHESLIVALFIFRRRPIDASYDPIHWITGFVAVLAPLLFRPGGVAVLGLSGPYMGLQVIGAVLSLYGLVHLGRSFGVVAANRGVKVTGPYRFVRHPMYAGYLITHVGYLLSAFSPANVAIFAVVYLAQVPRILGEESVLLRDPSYRTYASQVRYRLLPRLF